MRIPFTLGFGEKPYILIGRSSVVDRYDDILSNDDRTLFKHPLIVGARATGKTVLLHRLLDIAKQHKYVTEYISTQTGIYEQLIYDLSGMEFIASKVKKLEVNPSATVSVPSSTGSTMFSISGIRVERNEDKRFFDIDLATAICSILNKKKAKGVAIAIDEMNMAYIDDIRKIATTMQTLIANGFPVSFIGAGIPEYIDEIKNDTSISFIRRMGQIDIGNLALDDIARAIDKTCHDYGIKTDEQASIAIANASDGSPFIAQLFAYNACAIARKRNSKHINITIDDCYDGFEEGLSTIFTSLVKPTLKSLTEKELDFMRAMGELYPASKIKIGDVVKITGQTKQYINIYKHRLIDKRVIKGDGRGYIKCIIPYMTMYLSNPSKYDETTTTDMTSMDNDPTAWTRR